QPANDGTVGQAFVAVLPAHYAEHLVEPILNHAGIDERDGEGTIAADRLGFELDLGEVERSGERLGDRLDIHFWGNHRVLALILRHGSDSFGLFADGVRIFTVQLISIRKFRKTARSDGCAGAARWLDCRHSSEGTSNVYSGGSPRPVDAEEQR